MVARYPFTGSSQRRMSVQLHARAHPLLLLFLALCLLPAFGVAAPVAASNDSAAKPNKGRDILYVGDTLRVGVRATPGSEEPPLAVVLTGTVLEVVARQGRYVRIRTPAGRVGWVNAAYLSAVQPAVSVLPQVRRRNAALRAQRKALRAALARSQQVRQRLEQARLRLRVAQRRLQAQLVVLQRRMATPVWLYRLLVILAVAGGCFAVGALWHRGRVARRLGGLRL